MRKTLDSFLDEKKLFDSHNQMGENLKFFYQTSNIFLSNIKKLYDVFGREIVEPLEKYKSEINGNYSLLFKEFKDISEKYKLANDQVVKIKNKYYFLNQNLIKIDKENSPDLYLKTKAQVDICAEMYKYEIINANNLYSKYDIEYTNLYDKIKTNEEKRLIFIKDIIDKYIQSLHELIVDENDFVNQIESKLNIWEKEQDIAVFNEEFKFKKTILNGKTYRFPMETFEEFSTDIPYITEDPFKNISNSLLSKGIQIISLFSDYEIINKMQSEVFQSKIINTFFDYLKTDEEIPVDIICNTNRLLLQHTDFTVNFLNNYLSILKDSYFQVIHYKNLYHFANVINAMILLCNVDEDATYLEIINAILLQIGQCTFALKKKKPFNQYSNEKIFLCAIMGKSLIFKSHEFWGAFIEFKLKKKLEDVKKTISEKYEEYKKKELTTNEEARNTLNEENIPQGGNKDNLVDSIKNKINYFFTNDKKEKNAKSREKSSDKRREKSSDKNSDKKREKSSDKTSDKKENKEMKKISLYRKTLQKKKKNKKFSTFCNFTPIFETLPPSLQEEFTLHSNLSLKDIFKETIPSFINFNLGPTNSIDFIVKICNKFGVENEMINLYVICLNTNSFSVKQFPDIYCEHPKLRENIENLRENRKDVIFSNYPIYEGIEKIREQGKLIILQSTIPFLSFKEKVSLLLLSKKFSNKIKKFVYKDILYNSNNLSIKTRLDVWKTLLKVGNLKKIYNYEECLSKAREVKYDRFSNSPFSVIDLDVLRTGFDKNVKESRKAIENVLKSIANLIPTIGYCQGMNFIVAFIFKLTSSEEETFYLLLGLLLNTKFSKIFYNDLKKLKRDFVIFEKILNLYLPMTSQSLNANNILGNYYLSAWFITLFTNTLYNNCPLKNIMKIWDSFLLCGWKSVFNVTLSLLELNEGNFVSLRLEQLMHYLGNEIIKSTIFQNNEQFEFLITHPKIKKRLINNIKNEMKHENNLIKLKVKPYEGLI